MHSSGIDALFRASHSVPSINSSTSLPLMLWLPKCQPADASGVSTSTMRLLTVPFPWGPHWRRIQHQRQLHKASQAGEINTGICSSILSPGAPAPNCPPSITRAGKFASSISPAPAIFPTAEGPMCAGAVSRNTQLQSVVLQGQSPLNLDSFQCYLACHLDRQWSQSLLQGICKGVDMGYQGKRKTVLSGNWKSAVDNGSVVSEYLTAEVALGRKAGLFNQLPFLTYIGSPMGTVIKKHLDC